MRRLLKINLLFVGFFVYGLFISQYNLNIINEVLEPKHPRHFYDYRGATHVHSSMGLGSGSYFDVIEAAKQAKLDFIFFTDLNFFEKTFEIEGYHQQLLASVGAQYSYLESRLLHYETNNHTPFESLGKAHVALADLLSQSGSDSHKDMLILAHPFKAGYSWSGTFPSGLDGLEVINLKSIWQHTWNKAKISFLWSVLLYPFNSELALLRLYDEPNEELKLWDQLSSERQTIGFAGTDASAKTAPIGNFSFHFPSYAVSFGLLSNHVLLSSEFTGSANHDRRKLLEALRLGHFYMSLDLLGNPKGFSAFVADGEKILNMGSEVKWQEGMKLIVHLPSKPNVPFETAILKNGELVKSSNDLDTEYNISGPGAYRVVVRVFPTLPLPDGQRWLSWIYTNPFYLREKALR